MAFPQHTTLADSFDRADDAIHAGAGSTIWTDDILGAGTGGNWVVASNRAAPNGAGTQCVSQSLGPAILPAGGGEFYMDLPTHGAGGTYFAVYWGLKNPDAGWEGYWLIFETDHWTLKKRVSGVISTVDAVVVAAGDKIGVHHTGSTIRVRQYSTGAWDQTPILDVTDASIDAGGPFCFEATGAWTVDNLFADVADPEAGGGGGTPVTIYVDADDPAASDAYIRGQASNPATPLLTDTRAGQLALPGDTISVRYAVNANPDDPFQADVYPGISHNDGDGALPHGDNTGEDPITVLGVSVDGQKPKALKSVCGAGLVGWVVENFQFGYDAVALGDDGGAGGNDTLTIQNMQYCADMTFRDCDWTGGAYFAVQPTGEILFEDCTWRHPLSPFAGSGNRFLDGVGMKVTLNSAEGATGECEWIMRRCEVFECGGEDGLQIGMGTADQANCTFLAEDCYFHDILFNEDLGVHTDAVQILGGPSYIFKRCRWDRITNAITAIPYHNGLVRLENCLINGAALTDPDVAGVGLQVVNTDVLEIVHCTIVNNGFALALAHGDTPGVVPLRKLVNSVLEGVWDTVETFDAASVDTHNTVFKEQGGYVIPVADIEGIPEFGTSGDTVFELSNSPTVTVGIDAGTADEGVAGTTLPATDRLARARNGVPDIGCHELQPGVTVTPQARPPRLVSFTPASGADEVELDADVLLTFFPKPGETLNEATVTSTELWVTDTVRAISIPAVLSVAAPDVNGYQLVTVDLKASLSPVREGVLLELASYTVHVAGVEDTEGSEVVATSWLFTATAPEGAAIASADADPDPFTSVAASQRTTNGCVVTFNSAALDMNPVGMKTLQHFFDKLTMDTAGDETGNTSPTVSIGPLT